MGKRLKETLSLRDIDKIKALFDEHNWAVENEERSVFSKFCIRARSLPDNECRELFFELTERFCKISDDQYLKLIIQAVDKVFVDYPELDSCKVIFIYQLIAPKDYKARHTKSSGRVWYTFYQPELMAGRSLRGHKVKLRERVNMNVVDEVNRGKACIFLVDDYVGTGGTADEAIDPLLQKKICRDRIVVISLVAQQEGIEYVKNKGIKISSALIMKKGITDYYSNEEAEKRKRIMKRIENKLGVEKKYEFGYGKSEGLVTLIRTPNNTFPVFWYEPSNDNLAPFVRKR